MSIVAQKDCQELYEEYVDLARKTRLMAETYVPGKPLRVQTINPEDILKKEELRKKLLDRCRPFLESKLSPEELFEIENE